MKKNILKGLLITGLFLSSAQINKTYAQFDIENLSFGANIGYKGWSGLGSHVAFGFRGHYAQSEKIAVNFDYNTQIPVTTDAYTITARDVNNSSNPSKSVEVTDKISFHNISVDGNYYFVNDLEESFGLYALGGVGITFATLTPQLADYDKQKYRVDSDQEEAASFVGFIINAGIGTNFMISDQLAIFGEARIGLPANRANNVVINNPIPFNYGILVGVRFNPFN